MQYSKSVDQTIFIDEKTMIKVNDMIIFPHGHDGFHLWEAGIVLTRYLLKNERDNFANKKILELGTGVGITGIMLAKYANCQSVSMTDYNDQVLQNAQKNALKNLKESKQWSFFNLNWINYQQFEEKYDFIVGADLIYSGAPLESLSHLVKKALVSGGSFFLLVPTQRFCFPQFLEYIKSDNSMSIEEILLEDQKYYAKALKEEKESDKYYPGLKELKFYIYKFTKL